MHIISQVLKYLIHRESFNMLSTIIDFQRFNIILYRVIDDTGVSRGYSIVRRH